ncbi:MAG: LuxR C-terminal-related transcriptional regulator, partial [Deltaproteobacteria bacterium]|nr:LuxR C-terminal-related transcriptional regulator [Deltaproteobacteria bacterium]
TPIAQGRAISLGPEELRFTYPEFRAFLGSELTSERLGALWQESQGWPIAACLQRNFNQTNATEASQVGDNWVASRLMRGMATSDRKFLLEAACFEWADEDLFDEVLGVGSTQRLRELAILRGLLQRIDSGTRFRLHALIRRYAESELAGEDRDLRRRMAVAFAARGRTVDAVRQALRANDGGLAAAIVEDGGAIRLVCAFGVRGLQDAVGLLPEDIVRKSPRLRLAWLAAQAIGGKAFDPVAAGGILAVATGDGNDDDLRTDSLMLRGLMLMCGCVPAGSDAVRSVMVEGELAIAQTGFDPVVSAAISYGQAANHYQLGHLDAALAAIRRARGFSLETPSLALAAWILEGAILFAAGDVASSEAALTEALNTAQRQFPGHESPQLIGDAFAAEAAIEANRTTVARRRVPPLDRLARVGAWLDVYAASVDVRVELAHRQNAPAHASAILREAWEFARARGLSTFCRWLAAVRASALIRAGRQDEANELWRETGLPSDLEQLVDMAQQSWREMEAICCARVRLLLAGEDYAGALALGDAFAARARGSSVVRLQSWATAQAMCAAWRGGERRRAREYLVENLQLFRRTGFSRALLADPGTAAAVLEDLDTDDENLIAAKRGVLELIAISGSHTEVMFTNREIEILARLSDHRDKEIARALGLTDNGIRYHVRKVFAKLGAANRQEAVRKAKRLGVLTAVSGAADPARLRGPQHRCSSPPSGPVRTQAGSVSAADQLAKAVYLLLSKEPNRS